MLQSIHDKIQGWFAGVVALIIALVFALFGIQDYLRGPNNRIVAKVNGQEILQEQLRLAYEQAKQMEFLRHGGEITFDQKQQLKLKEEVLQRLIKRAVLLQAVNKMGLEISQQQLWSLIISIPAFQVDGVFSLNRFKQIVSKMALSEQEFFHDLRLSFLQGQLESGITKSEFLLPGEAKLVEKNSRQIRDYSYLLVTQERFIPEVKIAQDMVQKYYEQHQSSFLLPEKLNIQYLELTKDNLPLLSKPTADTLKQFYQSHLSLFSTPKKIQAVKVTMPIGSNVTPKAVSDIEQQLKKIATLMKSGQELTQTSKAKITTVWLNQNEMPEDFQANFNKLVLGEISAPYWNKDDYSLLKVIAIQPSKVAPYDEVANKVKTLYEQQQLAKAFAEASDKLADLVYTNSDSLEPAAKELGLKIKESGLFTKSGSKTGILTNHKLITAAFSDSVLQQRYNSNLIELGGGRIVVLRIKDYIPEKVEPLSKVSEKIIELLRKQELKKKMVGFADLLLTELQGGKSESELQTKYNLIWHKKVGVGYLQGNHSDKLTAAAFNLTKARDATAITVVDLNGNYAVLRLDKIAESPANQRDGAVPMPLLQILPRLLGEFDYQILTDSFVRQAKIKIIEKFSAL